jgi:DNA-binding CsgD family transcriptional regulator
MAMSATRDARVYDEVKRLCYAGLDAETLHRRALDCIGRAVAFDGACSHDADPASGLVTRMHLYPPNERAGRFFLENIYFEQDVNDFNWMLAARRPVALLSKTTGGRLDRSLRYREALSPRGFHFDLRAVFTSNQKHWGGVSLMRAKGEPDFTDRDVALVTRLAPHLAAGLKSAVLQAQAPADGEVAGVLILDDHGRVAHYTASAERWLRELDDLGPDWLDGPGLPPAVFLALGALRRSLGTPGDAAGVPRISAQTRTGRWLQLQAALSENGSSAIFVIEPAGPRELVWLHTEAYALSAREREVVELVVRGASTKQIEDALCISEDTVQEHLSHAFDKVGVRGRRALVKRLYFDNFYPKTAPHDSPPSPPAAPPGR